MNPVFKGTVILLIYFGVFLNISLQKSDLHQNSNDQVRL